MNLHTELLILFGQFFLSKSQLGIGLVVFFLPSKAFFWVQKGGVGGGGACFVLTPLIWEKTKELVLTKVNISHHLNVERSSDSFDPRFSDLVDGFISR